MRRASVLCTTYLLLALVACGGDDSGDSNRSAASDARSPNIRAATANAEERQEESGTEASRQPGSRRRTNDAPEPGTKAVAPRVPVVPGGDNSVQAFGVEGGTGEREQALATLRAYLKARAAGEWAKACDETSQEFKKQAAQLVEIAPGKEKPEGCAATLRLFVGSLPRSALRRSAVVEELLSFRVRGGYAYVIFTGAGGKVRFIAMANDRGRWKVNTTEPGTFSPSG